MVIKNHNDGSLFIKQIKQYRNYKCEIPNILYEILVLGSASHISREDEHDAPHPTHGDLIMEVDPHAGSIQRQ